MIGQVLGLMVKVGILVINLLFIVAAIETEAIRGTYVLASLILAFVAGVLATSILLDVVVILHED